MAVGLAWLLVAAFGVAPAGARADSDWRVEGTDGPGNVGDHASVAVDGTEVQSFPPPFLFHWEFAEGSGPGGIDIGADGFVYVTENQHDRVTKWTADGRFVTAWNSWVSSDDPNRTQRFNFPADLSVGPSGRVYVVDPGNARVVVFESDGAFVREWTFLAEGESLEQEGGFGIEVDDEENVYVAAEKWALHKYTENGEPLMEFNGDINSPVGVGVDSAGNVFVASKVYDKVVKFSPEGNKIREAGSEKPGGGCCYFPHGLAVDSNDNVWLVDAGNNEVRLFDNDLNEVGSFGRTGDGPAEFNGPWGVAVDDGGNVYVADSRNSRVQKFGPPVGSEIVVEASADTYVRADLDARLNDNYGCHHFFAVGTSRDSADRQRGDADAMRSLIRFDLEGLPATPVSRATLELVVYGFDNGTTESVYAVDVHRVVASGDGNQWEEGRGFEFGRGGLPDLPIPPGCEGTDPAGGVAWTGVDPENTAQPEFDPVVIDSASVHQATTVNGDVVTLDVTGVVRSWIDRTEPNFGLLLRDITTDGLFRGIRFGAREGLLFGVDGIEPSVVGPRLVLEYDEAPIKAEPTVESVIADAGSAQIAEVSKGTFEPGSYQVELLSEYSAHHAVNALSTYTASSGERRPLFDGTEGAFGKIEPGLAVTLNANFEFGFVMTSDPAGQESTEFFTEALRNQDGRSHTKVFRDDAVSGTHYIGFEDWIDSDYQDMVVRITKLEEPAPGCYEHTTDARTDLLYLGPANTADNIQDTFRNDGTCGKSKGPRVFALVVAADLAGAQSVCTDLGGTAISEGLSLREAGWQGFPDDAWLCIGIGQLDADRVRTRLLPPGLASENGFG